MASYFFTFFIVSQPLGSELFHVFVMSGSIRCIWAIIYENFPHYFF